MFGRFQSVPARSGDCDRQPTSSRVNRQVKATMLEVSRCLSNMPPHSAQKHAAQTARQNQTDSAAASAVMPVRDPSKLCAKHRCLTSCGTLGLKAPRTPSAEPMSPSRKQERGTGGRLNLASEMGPSAPACCVFVFLFRLRLVLNSGSLGQRPHSESQPLILTPGQHRSRPGCNPSNLRSLDMAAAGLQRYRPNATTPSSPAPSRSLEIGSN